ncbi:MAG: hypothetical protein QXP27_05135 [Candidatus Methanomethyliaceae archaeon]
MVRGLGPVVTLAHLAPHPLLRKKLPHRLKEVQQKPPVRVNGPKEGEIFRGVVPGVPHKSPHCGPVLLPHMSLVVLLVRAAAGERYFLSCTVPGKMAIEESAVIVGVQAKKRVWNCSPSLELRAVNMKQAINGSWAQFQEKPLRLRPDPELPMALERSDDLRKKGSEAFRTYMATGFPELKQGSLHVWGVRARTSPPIQVGRTDPRCRSRIADLR